MGVNPQGNPVLALANTLLETARLRLVFPLPPIIILPHGKEN